MLLGGVSILGTYHEYNQDSFLSCCYERGYVLAVSDGLGSKDRSQIGSRALCDSVLELAETTFDFVDPHKILEKLHKIWLRRLSEEDIDQCGCTSLLCIITVEEILVARLGDGFLYLDMEEGSIALFDRKVDRFVNETDCLTSNFSPWAWEYAVVPNKGFRGVIACTDGVVLNNEEEIYRDFSCDLMEEYRHCTPQNTADLITQWLSQWPSSDDKTIGYLIQNEV